MTRLPHIADFVRDMSERTLDKKRVALPMTKIGALPVTKILIQFYLLFIDTTCLLFVTQTMFLFHKSSNSSHKNND